VVREIARDRFLGFGVNDHGVSVPGDTDHGTFREIQARLHPDFVFDGTLGFGIGARTEKRRCDAEIPWNGSVLKICIVRSCGDFVKLRDFANVSSPGVCS
jgi:hypothetical protein